MGVRVALLIGTKRYEDRTFASLRAPDADLSALAAVLRSPNICGFDYVQTMLDASASEARIAVSMLLTRAAPDDLVLIYFTGHGVLDEQGQLYFCLRDTQRALIRPTAMPASVLRDEMAYCRSRRQVLILDCCHSGAFERTKSGGVGTRVGTEAHFSGSGRGRIVLTSSDATQFAFEGDKVTGESQQSLFTHYLIEGLQTGAADTNGDGQISVDELYDYTYEKVIRETPGQTPGKWAYKQQGIVVLAKNPRPVPLPELIDQGLIDGIAPTKPLSIRLAAVSEMGKLLLDGRPGVSLAAQQLLAPLGRDDSRRISTLVEEAWRHASLDAALLTTVVRDADAGRHESSKPPPPSHGDAVGLHRSDSRSSLPTASVTVPPAAPMSSTAPLASSSGQGRGWRNWTFAAAAALIGAGAFATTLVHRLVLPPNSQKLSLAGKHFASRLGVVPPPAPNPAASVDPPVRRPKLRIELSDELAGAKTFLVTDGKAERIVRFPHELDLDPARRYQIESYLGKTKLLRPVAIERSQSEQVIRLTSSDAWTAKPEASVAPPPPPKARLLVTGAPLTGVSAAALNRTLASLRPGLARCVEGSQAGNVKFQLKISAAGSVASAMRHSSGTLAGAETACLSSVLKSGTYAPDSSEGGTVQIDISVSD